MKRLQKVSILLYLLDSLKEKGSWCGETHIQKAVYFLKDLMKVQMDFEFIIYKHGPFSFDLRDELTAMRADGLIEIKLQPSPYGPTLCSTEVGKAIMSHFKKTLNKYKCKIEYIADFLGDKGVEELERIGTALFITNEKPSVKLKDNAEYIHKIKPHVSEPDAINALETVQKQIKDVNEKFKV